MLFQANDYNAVKALTTKNPGIVDYRYDQSHDRILYGKEREHVAEGLDDDTPFLCACAYGQVERPLLFYLHT